MHVDPSNYRIFLYERSINNTGFFMRDTVFFKNIYERSIKNTGVFMTYMREACRVPPRKGDLRPFFRVGNAPSNFQVFNFFKFQGEARTRPISVSLCRPWGGEGGWSAT